MLILLQTPIFSRWSLPLTIRIRIQESHPDPDTDPRHCLQDIFVIVRHIKGTHIVTKAGSYGQKVMSSRPVKIQKSVNQTFHYVPNVLPTKYFFCRLHCYGGVTWYDCWAFGSRLGLPCIDPPLDSENLFPHYQAVLEFFWTMYGGQEPSRKRVLVPARQPT